MKTPEWLKPGIYGALLGAAFVGIVGFSWGGWMTGGGAEEMALARTAIWRRLASKVSTLMHRNDLKLSRVWSKGIFGSLALLSFTEFLALSFVALITIGSPSFAQSQSAPMPANAQPKSYGEGWECDRGYRRDGDVCLAIIVPENAYATNRTYGKGWECLHGFQEVDDAVCFEVVVPEGGYLDPSGQRWNCLRGYMKVDDLCLKIDLPPNAYLTNRGYGAAWLCDRGYEVEGDTCVAIAVPENAFLNGSGYGRPWTCERGYFERDDTCEAVFVPENAYFDDASYGPGWKCHRGFEESEEGCTEIDIPDNAHLDRSGNRWECHRNFQRSQGRCVLND